MGLLPRAQVRTHNSALQGSGKAAITRNAPDSSYGRKALTNTPRCGQGWAGPHAHPRASTHSWRLASATGGHREHRHRLSRAGTRSQARGRGTESAWASCKGGQGMCERIRLHRATGEKLEPCWDSKSPGKGGRSSKERREWAEPFKISGAQLPHSQISQMAKEGRITWRFCQAQGFCNSSSRLRI